MFPGDPEGDRSLKDKIHLYKHIRESKSHVPNVERAAFDDLYDYAVWLRSELDRRNATVDVLRRALRFYADGKHYTEFDLPYINSHQRQGDKGYDVEDFGDEAQKALRWKPDQ